MDALLSAAPSGVWDDLVTSLVQFVLAGFLVSLFVWLFGLAGEILTGFFRDII